MKLISKILSPNKEVVYLTFQPENKVEFKAGQFMMLDNWEIKRAYSIASSPLDNNLSFYIKKASENGMSKYFVEDINVWDEISSIWPFGHMILEENETTNYLLVSVWSGLGPILSIYRTFLKSWKYNKLVNIFGERYEDTIVKDILEELSINNEKTKNIIHLSREEKEWFETWYVQESFADAVKFLWEDTVVYMCWKPSMVDESVEKLIDLWIKKENIKFEKF